MPGLNQLKKFSDDMRELGDEVKIRAQRGEKTPQLPLPEGISEADDSNDFLIGMPDGSDTAKNPDDALDLLDDNLGSDIDVSGLDSILDPQFSADDADLADFLDDNPDSDATDAAVAEILAADEPSPAEEAEETPLEDMDLDSLLQPSSSSDDSLEEGGSLETADSLEGGDALEPADSLDSLDSSDTSFDIPDNLPAGDDFTSEEINLNEDLPASVLENDGTPPVKPDDFSTEDTPNLSGNLDLGGFDIDSLIDGDDSGSDLGAESTVDDNSPADTVSDFDTGLAADVAASPEGDFTSEASEASDSGLGGENPFAGMGDLPDMGMDFDSFSGSASDAPSPDESIPDASDEVPDTPSESAGGEDFSVESFDTSDMDGVDFGPSPSASGDEFPATDDGLGNDDDFILDSSFEIPGFSDTETADMGKKKPVLDTVDFSKGKEGRPKNSLTEEEYVQFKKNLSNYPLNLRIALEDFIARDEFTDDAVFEIIEKVLKKASARQLATQLEKILDISINIPRDFERRSFAEYEAYKQSFQYQLKNRIIPAAVVGIVIAFVCVGLFRAGVHFIYNPVMANIHYKQGYTLLEANEFPQSEKEFVTAVTYKPVRKWFFKYADGYRSKKQFDRAAQMYKNTLAMFNHDKQAGLEYAEMELYERANYERAEEIVRREVLDYHINDADGILMLGDVFLEWAEVEPEKYELAKQEYLDLIQRYGSNNVYLSRMLRYNIRTDKLRDVLTYKNMFYVSKQDRQNLKNLGASDWTELSGYLLDKLYGTLSKNDEYLRSSIEDVLAMLNLAIKADPSNPIARYNLAIYFIQNGNTEQAKVELERSIDLFSGVSVRTKKNVYREINATRVLGELYSGNREYLKAQTVYTRGINLYNEEHENSNLEGDENTGKLFADMGDLDYFISGEMDDALYNYEKAIEIKNDTPSINYRVGSIYYNRKNYDNALVSFIKVAEKEPKDPNVLLSLGNVLSLRGDNFAAESYYADLLSVLDQERPKILTPQENGDDYEIVDLYLKANNNLGVTLYRLAQQTGNSNMNAEAMVRLSDSIRAWDSLTRNPNTMIRLEGSNLAAQNSKYITHPYPEFEPAIYTDIPRLLAGEKGLE